MNASNAKDYLPLVQALAEGRAIQFNCNTWTEPKWIDVERVLDSNPAHCYRIKPEPREIWSNRYPDGSESATKFTSEKAAMLATSNAKATQVCYREVIE